MYLNYRDRKKNGQISQSKSNGSSFQSNSSISSNLSNNNNNSNNVIVNSTSNTGSVTNTMMMMVMPLLSNKSPAHNVIKSLVNIPKSTIPPKPPKFNPNGNKTEEHSPQKFCVALSASQNNTSNQNVSLKLRTSSFNDDESQSFEAFGDNKINKPSKLDEKLKTMTLRHNLNNRNTVNSGISSNESGGRVARITSPQKTIDLIRRPPTPPPSASTIDLILRDRTLVFIQSISNFIRYLNTENISLLDYQLKEIVNSFKSLINMISEIECYNKCEIINRQISEMENCLNRLIREFKHLDLGVNIETSILTTVVNSSLEMARKANELFLLITKNDTR
jgi:hypothetical protein